MRTHGYEMTTGNDHHILEESELFEAMDVAAHSSMEEELAAAFVEGFAQASGLSVAK